MLFFLNYFFSFLQSAPCPTIPNFQCSKISMWCIIIYNRMGQKYRHVYANVAKMVIGHIFIQFVVHIFIINRLRWKLNWRIVTTWIYWRSVTMLILLFTKSEDVFWLIINTSNWISIRNQVIQGKLFSTALTWKPHYSIFIFILFYFLSIADAKAWSYLKHTHPLMGNV